MNHNFSETLLIKARGIKLLVLDVDGVLTNGKLYFGLDGEIMKRFSALDGLGIKLLQKYGIQTAIVTARSSGILLARAKELSIEHIIQGREDKLQATMELINTINISLSETAYIGDDLPDLAVIQSCQLGIATANAYQLVKDTADWVCSKHGGDGAVREVTDLILYANNHYESAMQAFNAP